MKNLNWQMYKKRRLVLLLGVGTTFFLVMLFSQYKVNHITFFVFYFGWGIGVLIPLAFRFGMCPCPNCLKPIHYKKGFGYPFGPKCLHCGIKVGAVDVEIQK
jgi:hypothetical protein